MKDNKILIIVISIILVFLISLIVSYNLIVNDKENKNQNIEDNNSVKIYGDEVNSSSKDEYKQININSSLAEELYEFLPKNYQTYPNKMTDDYIIYDAIMRLSKDESIEKVEINGYYGYKYDDVNNKLKQIYGPKKEAQKKSEYISPIEYFEKENIFSVYPYTFDNTHNIMVLKSVEENSTSYKVTVYSLGIYVDLSSGSYDSVYIKTKSTIDKYYQMVPRNSEDIVSTYRKYQLQGENFDPEDVIKQYEQYLPQIEFCINKLDERGTKYYISDIKDIY